MLHIVIYIIICIFHFIYHCIYIYVYTCGFNEFMCVDVGSIPALLLVCYDVNPGLIDPVITLGYHHIIDKLRTLQRPHKKMVDLLKWWGEIAFLGCGRWQLGVILSSSNGWFTWHPGPPWDARCGGGAPESASALALLGAATAAAEADPGGGGGVDGNRWKLWFMSFLYHNHHLVAGLEHFLFSIIYGILPID